jgi:hypothetical protein
VLADFANTTGDAFFDDTLKQALAVQLEQSPFLNILSDRKVAQTLRLMGRSPEQPVTGEVARELCQRVGSKAMLAGSISSLGNEYVIGLNAINCATGDALVKEQVEARGKEDVLKALGNAATEMRGKLGESLSMVQKFDTHSWRTFTVRCARDRPRRFSCASRSRKRSATRSSQPWSDASGQSAATRP